MATLPSSFKSPKGEAEYMAAYEDRMRLCPIPYESMDVRGRYGRTHLVASGPKDALLLALLHGALASLTMWAANIADLSRDYRVYAVDIIGEPNKSIPTQPRQTREDCVAWLSELLDALNIESTDMVRISYGGWLTLNYAIDVPERLNKIALLTPPGSFVSLAKQFFVRLMLMRYLRSCLLVGSESTRKDRPGLGW
jgi:pimeloyl-ACP methyl ester carboxylesterase